MVGSYRTGQDEVASEPVCELRGHVLSLVRGDRPRTTRCPALAGAARRSASTASGVARWTCPTLSARSARGAVVSWENETPFTQVVPAPSMLP